MAENIYSKGTQVWFPDKELSWISGEVTSATRNADDSVKLVFLDERGKVCTAPIMLCIVGKLYEDYPNALWNRVGNCYKHDSEGDKGRQRGPSTVTQPSALGNRR